MQAVPTQAYTYLHHNGGLHPVAYNQGNYLDVPDLSYAASSPESIASPRTPYVVATSLPLQQTSKKSRSRRSKDPNHVGRPSNSFMIFRSEHNARVQNAGNVHRINQQEISRNAAVLWRNLSREEKQRYVDAAAEQSRRQHECHPDNSHSKPSKKCGSTSIKRAREQKPYDRPPNKTTEHVNAKNDDVGVMPLETVPFSSVVPGPSTEQWLGPQPSQFIDPMLTQCIPTNAADQTYHAAVDPQFGLNLDSMYWQPGPPMPPSVDTATQLALPPADQDLDSFNYNNWPLSNEPTNMSASQLDDHSQQLFDQFLSDLTSQ